MCIEQPPDFVNPTFADHICLLNESFYGLKQALHAWFERLSHYLFTLGFYSKTDPSLFM